MAVANLPAPKPQSAPATRHLLTRVPIYLMLVLAAAGALVPFLWLLAATVKGNDDLFSYTFFPPVSGWSRLTLDNFRDLFTKVPFARYLLNSVFISCTIVVVQLFLSSLAGFALAKYDFKAKKLVYGIMVSTMMIPGQVTIAPSYELLYRLGLVDSYAGLIIPGAVSVFGIFLFERALRQVPDELIQAARIDGCTEFRIYWDVVMPISRPMIGAFCLISFMGAWNSFLWPQIMLHTNTRFTLPIGLTQMVGIYSQQYGMLMAGTFLSVLPVIVLFFLLQKEFVAGLTSGAVKG
jgi:multiple sugar transport system permease protein